MTGTMRDWTPTRFQGSDGDATVEQRGYDGRWVFSLITSGHSLTSYETPDEAMAEAEESHGASIGWRAVRWKRTGAEACVSRPRVDGDWVWVCQLKDCAPFNQIEVGGHAGCYDDARELALGAERFALWAAERALCHVRALSGDLGSLPPREWEITVRWEERWLKARCLATDQSEGQASE